MTRFRWYVVVGSVALVMLAWINVGRAQTIDPSQCPPTWLAQGCSKPVPADYDGDHIVDVAVFRLSDGVWFIDNSFGGRTYVQWGNAADIPVPADYDGDGRADIAVFRPSDATFYIRFATGVTVGRQVIP